MLFPAFVVPFTGLISDHAARHRGERAAAYSFADRRARGSADQLGLAGAAGQE